MEDPLALVPVRPELARPYFEDSLSRGTCVPAAVRDSGVLNRREVHGHRATDPQVGPSGRPRQAGPDTRLGVRQVSQRRQMV